MNSHIRNFYLSKPGSVSYRVEYEKVYYNILCGFQHDHYSIISCVELHKSKNIVGTCLQEKNQRTKT